MNTDDIAVLQSDLELIRDTLTTCYNRSYVDDLIKSYTNLSDRVKQSAMTNQIEGVLQKVQAYLEVPEEEEVEGEVEDVS